MVYVTPRADDATLEPVVRARLSGYPLEPVSSVQARTAHATRPADVQGHGTSAPMPRIAPPLRAVHAAGAPGAQPVRRQLEHVFASPDFDASPRSREFLRFVTEETLGGRAASLTQSAIAVRVFGRKEDFDALVDPIVRIQAGRLRRSLERYYLLSGRHDAIRIELPKGGYVPTFRHIATEASGEADSPAEEPDDGWPSVFLQAFEVAGAGSDLEEPAVRVDEELALELGRYRAAHLFREREDGLVPRHHVRFALGGRVRRENDDVRVTAHLVDRATGEQIWGDEYYIAAHAGRWSGSPEDIAHVIAVRVGAEEGVITQFLTAERRKCRPDAPTVYDAVLQAYEFFLTRDPKSFAPAVDGLRQAIATHPDNGPAWTQLARLYLASRTVETAAADTPLEEAVACAQRGVRLDPASRGARCVLAAALLAKGEAAAARDELEQVLRSSAGSLVHLEIIGSLLTRAGDPARGALLSRTARERNPHCLPQAMFGL